MKIRADKFWAKLDKKSSFGTVCIGELVSLVAEVAVQNDFFEVFRTHLKSESNPLNFEKKKSCSQKCSTGK